MKLKPDQLPGHLKQGLEALYLLASDQPLLLQEAAGEIRKAALPAGFETREVVSVDARSDWDAILAGAGAPSLFAQRRVLDLKLVSGRPGQAGARALTAYAESPAADVLLIVSVGSLEGSVRSAKWYKSLARAGVCVELWPPRPGEMARWVERRMRLAGLEPERDAAEVLAELSEGNLLAAQQEIDKLALLYPGETLTAETVGSAVADNARFDVFRIVDEMLAGNRERVVRVMGSLRAEGAPTPLVLWALTQDLMRLAEVAWECETGGGDPAAVLARQRMWPARRDLMRRALSRRSSAGWRALIARGAQVDRIIKGQSEGDPWIALERLALSAAGGGRA